MAKKVSEYDQEIPQSQNTDKPMVSWGRAKQQPRVTAKPEQTQSNAQQNIVQPQSPTLGATINNESTTTEPLPQNWQQPKPPRAQMHLTSTKVFFFKMVIDAGFFIHALDNF